VAGYRAGEGYREIDSVAVRTCESAVARLGSASAFVRTRGGRGGVGGVVRTACVR